MNILEGKVAVITGGSRGLGLGIASAFASEGAAVVIASRSQHAVDEAVAGLRARGLKASGLVVDVGDLAQVRALKEHALKEFGRLDIWVNNAGVAGPYGPTMDFAPEAFYQVVQTNILGVYNGSRTAMQHFLAQRSGKLINLLGHGYQGPVTWQNAYSASKIWIRSFTKALSNETRDSGVGVFAFNPGMVMTDLLRNVEVFSGSEEKLKNYPRILRMIAKPPEVPARKAVWLASAATDGKTGLLVSVFSPLTMLGGAVREGLRNLLKRPEPPLDLNIKTVPPAR